MYSIVLKRIVDFTLSLLGMIILLPIFLILCISVKIDSRGPIFFRQQRVGKNKKKFTIYKFRTMKTETPKEIPTHLLENPDFFITKIGKLLRKTSLDELPQLVNIIRGDMAIVGPRPALWNQYDLINERDKYGANNVRPGLTGLAQISGRDELDISVKAALDGRYVNNISLILDIKCFIGTFSAVFNSQGIVEGRTGALTKEDED